MSNLETVICPECGTPRKGHAIQSMAPLVGMCPHCCMFPTPTPNWDELLCRVMSERTGKKWNLLATGVIIVPGDVHFSFTESLDSIRLLQDVMTPEEWDLYVQHLMNIPQLGHWPWQKRIRHTTALQCAEAAVRALGLGKEGGVN